MCGIIGVLSAINCPTCSWINESAQTLAHRGPNTAGFTTVNLKQSGMKASLAMYRLSIVDTSPIQVPYHFSYIGVTLAYNGEVYNWQDLRMRLQNGHPWETHCDSEVIARAWRLWGPACLDTFNGMWSFILIDELDGSIFIARDRAGKKPLFYTVRGERLYLASEIKGLPIALEEHICTDMDAFEFDFGVETPFKGIYRLLPGHQIYIQRKEQIATPKTTSWWGFPATCNTTTEGTHVPERMYMGTYTDAVEETEAVILDAVKIRTTAEVPIALQLSGGLDSAIIHHAWKKLNTSSEGQLRAYCMDFTTEGINNISAAWQANPDTIPLSMTANDVQLLTPKIAYHLDTPATWSAYCLWRLAEQIHADGHKIVISGEGADELFAGYTRYRILYWMDRMRKDEHLNAYTPTIQHLFGAPASLLGKLEDRSKNGTLIPYTTTLVKHFAGKAIEQSLVRSAMRVEFYTTMQVLLRMGDRMAAAWGVENRCPFLDYRLIELSAQFPTDWLITSQESKHILRDVARRLDVPSAIVDEQTKRGLAIPLSKWAQALGISTVGSRGPWDRSGFASMMKSAWRARCIRDSLCSNCSK